MRYLRFYRRRLARLAAATRAATAVEFALIAPFFLGILIAILEVSVYLFAQQALQTAAMQAGRLFMTGQAQSDSQTAFKTQICQSYLPSALFKCSSLVVVVQTYA